MNLLIESVLARVQRELKVDICHFVVMGNHFHFIVVAKDSRKFKDFYAMLAKSKESHNLILKPNAWMGEFIFHDNKTDINDFLWFETDFFFFFLLGLTEEEMENLY